MADQIIDLGDETVITVKYAGQEYKMREPTVEEVDAFGAHDKIKDGAIFLADFLNKLGMPKDVVSKMGMSKARKLVDSLMDMLTKKK